VHSYRKTLLQKNSIIPELTELPNGIKGRRQCGCQGATWRGKNPHFKGNPELDHVRTQMPPWIVTSLRQIPIFGRKPHALLCAMTQFIGTLLIVGAEGVAAALAHSHQFVAEFSKPETADLILKCNCSNL
jgi:hypothetical protein